MSEKNLTTKKFINENELILIGYSDTAKRANLIRLLEYWLDSQDDGEFERLYPYVAEHFELVVFEAAPLEPGIFREDIARFANLPHAKGWFQGEEFTLAIGG